MMAVYGMALPVSAHALDVVVHGTDGAPLPLTMVSPVPLNVRVRPAVMASLVMLFKVRVLPLTMLLVMVPPAALTVATSVTGEIGAPTAWVPLRLQV